MRLGYGLDGWKWAVVKVGLTCSGQSVDRSTIPYGFRPYWKSPWILVCYSCMHYIGPIAWENARVRLCPRKRRNGSGTKRYSCNMHCCNAKMFWSSVRCMLGAIWRHSCVFEFSEAIKMCLSGLSSLSWYIDDVCMTQQCWLSRAQLSQDRMHSL